MSQQRRWTLLVLALVAVSSGLFCGSPSAQDTEATAVSVSSEIVAEVGESKITLDELDKMVRTRNAKAYQAFYDARRQILDQLITDEVIGKEAESKGLTPQQLQNEVTKDLQPATDEEVRAFFDSNQSRMGGKTFEQMEQQIRNHLVTTRNRERLVAYVDELKRKSGVKIFLEPPRMEVKIASHDPSMGPEDAPILLVEYSDFQ
jgi:hypothetical protein